MELLKIVNIKEFKDNIGKVVLHKNSFDYILLLVQGKVALIEVKASDSMVRCYEVWKLREQGPGSLTEGNLRFPSNDEFGRYGWSYTNRKDAEVKYNLLKGEDNE